MSTRRFPAPRGRDAAFLGACLLLAVALVPGAVLRGEVLSHAQLLFTFAPWQAHAPADLPPVNSFLVDPPLVFYPFLAFAADAVRQGHFPVWSAALYGGHPFLASFQAAVCSPFLVIAYLLPLPFATVPLALAPLLVGALGMRKLVAGLGCGEAASWYGGLAWLLNGFAIVWLEHPLTAVACWLPWLLVAVERVAASPRGGSVAWLACAVAASILAGHPETVLKVLLLTAAWAVHRAWGRPRAAWFALAAGGAAGVLLAAVQVVPFAEYLGLSEALARRSAASGNAFFLPVETLVTAVVPDFFGNPAHGAYLARANRFGIAANYGEQQVYAGAVTALLAPVGLVAGWRDARMRFFAGSLAAALALMYGLPGLLTVVSHLPILRVSILSRFGLVAITCAIVLAARGVDAIAAAPRPGATDDRPRLARALGLALASLVACVLVAWLTFADALAGAGLAAVSRNACLQAAGVLIVAAALCWPRLRGLVRPGAFGVAICALVAAELLVTAHGFHTTIAPRHVMPAVPEVEAVRRDRGLFRVYGWADQALLPNTAMAYGLQDARGWDGVQPARYTRLLDLGYLRQRRDPARHLANPVLLDLLNVKYVFVPRGVRLDAPRFEPLSGHAGVYRNTRVQPRAFLVDRYEVLDDRGLEGALHARRVDLAATALLERELEAGERPEPAAGGHVGAARIVHYRDTFVEIETDTDGRRILVLADAHYPGWRATVDGRPVAIHRADYALRAIAVDAGRHVVRFEYRPWSVRAGVAISACQGAALLAVVLLWRRKESARG